MSQSRATSMKRVSQLAMAFVAVVLVGLPLAFILFAWTVTWTAGSAIEGLFAPLITVDAAAEADIRDQFGRWIPETTEVKTCAYASVGIGGDHGEHAVFTADIEQIKEIAESFAGRSIDEFDHVYKGDDFAVTELEFDFPVDRRWIPANIINGRFCEIQDWTSPSSGSGKFVAVDYSESKIYMLKWIE